MRRTLGEGIRDLRQLGTEGGGGQICPKGRDVLYGQLPQNQLSAIGLRRLA